MDVWYIINGTVSFIAKKIKINCYTHSFSVYSVFDSILCMYYWFINLLTSNIPLKQWDNVYILIKKK